MNSPSAAGKKTPWMYRMVARKKYVTLAKNKCKRRAALRKGLCQQLQYVKRDLRYIEELAEGSEGLGGVLSQRDWKLLRVIHELYSQQRWMYQNKEQSIADRIVSIYQPHVRPMPRGKDRASTEFGSKQLVMLKDGYAHVCKLDWNNYNDGVWLAHALEQYKSLYGCYPQRVLGDKLYGNRANRAMLKGKGIRYVGQSPGKAQRG